jgi:flagellar basal-body rod protein FlgB
MASQNVDLFALAEQRLSWAEQRQALLAQNIANANTPGYKAKDVKSFDSVLSGATLAPTVTNPLHMTASDGGAAVATVTGGEAAPDGNGVEMDKELMKVADTDNTHELVTQIYTAYSGLFRTALGR